MKYFFIKGAIGLFFSCHTFKKSKVNTWISLFDGRTLNGWKANENIGTFTVENGNIVVNGDRSHLFYNGPYMKHDFKDFEMEAKVMTTAGSNSGIFFHTSFQDAGWPKKEYKVQVNNSHIDWRRTGSFYDVQDVKDPVC